MHKRLVPSKSTRLFDIHTILITIAEGKVAGGGGRRGVLKLPFHRA